MLWNTECLFCDWFKPISTWTFPSTTVSGGRRRRRRRRRRSAGGQESFAYHSMPDTRGVKPSRYRGYFYEKPLKLRRRRRLRKNDFSRRTLTITSPTERSDKLSRTLQLLKAGLEILLRIVNLFHKK